MLFNDQLLCPESFPWQFIDIVSSDTAIISVLFSNNKLDIKPNDIAQECKLQLSQYVKKELIDFKLLLFELRSIFLRQFILNY